MIAILSLILPGGGVGQSISCDHDTFYILLLIIAAMKKWLTTRDKRLNLVNLYM